MERKRVEKGQVLVLVALTLVALLGFGALALDGGNIYADRRSAQAAADTSAMSAALAIMRGSPNPQKTALLRAEENGYTHSPPGTSVTVNWPPVSPHPYAGKENYVQVIITNQLQTALAHLFYKGPFQHTVQAVAHLSRNEDLLVGYSVYGNNPSACPAVEFDGNPDTTVSGGGSILSNSLADCSCGSTGGAGVTRGTGSLTIGDAGGIYSAGCWGEYGGAFSSSPPPQGGAGQQSLASVPTPDCSDLPDNTGEGDKIFNGTATLQPGRYDSLWITSATGNVTFEPGIYCLAGTIDGILDVLAFQADSSATVVGSDVMIYLEAGAGGFRTGGTATVTLAAGDPRGSAVPELVDASGEDWRGMLLYADPGNTNQIHLSGKSGSDFFGSIYAIGSHCTVQGTSGVLALKTQLICDTVRMTGDGSVQIQYEEGAFYRAPDLIELFD